MRHWELLILAAAGCIESDCSRAVQSSAVPEWRASSRQHAACSYQLLVQACKEEVLPIGGTNLMKGSLVLGVVGGQTGRAYG